MRVPRPAQLCKSQVLAENYWPRDGETISEEFPTISAAGATKKPAAPKNPSS